MTEANLAIARKVVLWGGLLVSALLFLFPHWRLSIGETQVFDQEIGRAFIASPPVFAVILIYPPIDEKRSVRINYVRQFMELAIALLLTFGLPRALKKPARN
jgi:hypothetical protein